MTTKLPERARSYLSTLCREIPGRSVGSSGNIKATRFFEKELSNYGWHTAAAEFDAIDWEEYGAVLRSDGTEFNVLVSPYSLPFSGEAELAVATTINELQSAQIKNKIVLLSGEIAREQLMPKNFVFYNPDEHRQIISLLEQASPSAIISATGRNPDLAGGVYPFPLIEDGDFDIPSVFTTEEEGRRIAGETGKKIFLKSKSERIPGKGYNVTGTIGSENGRRIVVSAHIDAKKGTPGAIDNATGVVVLLLLQIC